MKMGLRLLQSGDVYFQLGYKDAQQNDVWADHIGIARSENGWIHTIGRKFNGL